MKIYKIKILIFFISLISFSQNKINSNCNTIDIDSIVLKEMSTWKVPGLSICVIKDNKVISIKSYGKININDTINVNNKTFFPIASLTKSFTSTSLLRLLKTKNISLDTKLNKYLDSYSLSNKSTIRDVTIRELLSHSTGYKSYQGDFFLQQNNFSKKEIIEKVWSINPYYSNKKNYGYQNVSYLFAGNLIEQLSNMKWFNYVDETILKPLNMNSTFEDYNKFIYNKNRAFPHRVEDDSLKVIFDVNEQKYNSTGGLYSNIEDLSKWLLFQINNGNIYEKEIICSEIIKKSHEKQVFIRPNNWYGLGWRIENISNNNIINHSGSINGFTSKISFCKEKKFGVVILTNLDESPVCEIISSNIIDKLLKIKTRNNSMFFRQLFDKYESEKNNIQNNKKPITQSLFGSYNNYLIGKVCISNMDNIIEFSFEEYPNKKFNYIGHKENLLVFKNINTQEELYLKIDKNILELTFMPFFDSNNYLFIKND